MVTLLNDRLLLLFLLFPTKTSDCLYVSTYRTFQTRVIFVRCDKSHERWACRGDVLLHKALLTLHSCCKENELTTGNVLNSLSCSWTNACKWRNKQTPDSCSYVSTERKFSKIFRCGMSQQFERRLVVRQDLALFQNLGKSHHYDLTESNLKRNTQRCVTLEGKQGTFHLYDVKFPSRPTPLWLI